MQTQEFTSIDDRRPGLSTSERIKLLGFIRRARTSETPTTIARYRTLMALDDPGLHTDGQVARLAKTTPWMVANVLEGFAVRGVAGALAGQWIDSSNRVADQNMAHRSADGLEARLSTAERQRTLPEAYQDPFKQPLEERFPGLTKHFVQQIRQIQGALAASTAAQVFADYVDLGVAVLHNQDEFIRRSALRNLTIDHSAALVLMNDVAQVGQRYLAERGLGELTTPKAGMLTSVILPALTGNAVVAEQLTGVLPVYIELYIAHRAVADQFPYASMAAVAEAIGVARDVPVSTVTLQTAVETVRSQAPHLDAVPVVAGQFVPGRVNWQNGVMSTEVNAGRLLTEVLDDPQLVLSDHDRSLIARLTAADPGAGQLFDQLDRVAAHLAAHPGEGAADLRRGTRLTNERLALLLAAHRRFGAAGVYAELRDDHLVMPAEAPAPARAAAQVHADGVDQAFTDIAETTGRLNGRREALLTFLGDVHAVGELPVAPPQALYMLAVLAELESRGAADDALWAEALLANAAVPADRVTPENLAALRGLWAEFTNAPAPALRKGLADAELGARPKKAAKPVRSVKGRRTAKAKAAEPVPAEPAPEPAAEPAPAAPEPVAAPAPVPAPMPAELPLSAPLAERLDTLEHMLRDVRAAQQHSVSQEHLDLVNEFMTTKVNGVAVADTLGVVLVGLGWRLTVVDGLLTPERIK